MDTIKLTAPHELPSGNYPAVWSSDTLYIERPQVDLKTVSGVRGRREGSVVVSGPDRMSVQFTDDQDRVPTRPLDVMLSAIAERMQACAGRLAAAPEQTAEAARAYAEGKADARVAAAFHQIGQIEQICRNEAAALECHIKWLRSAAGEQP